MRTAEGFGVEKAIFSGYTPYPGRGLPHMGAKLTKEISKTALGAEELLPFEFAEDIAELLRAMKAEGWKIVALENNIEDERKVFLNDPALGELIGEKAVLILGEEVGGVSAELLELADAVVEIPMKGQKESFNVSVAAGVAIYGMMFL
jgi:tRNA G18 (ribose-2'-O)-methylase SpoU